MRVPGKRGISFVQAAHTRATAVLTRGQLTEKSSFLQLSAALPCAQAVKAQSELSSVLPVGSAGSWDVLLCLSKEVLLLFYRVVQRGLHQVRTTFKT